METHFSHTASLQVDLTLWVGWACGKVNVVPRSVLQRPSEPHISGDGVSYPPGLRGDGRDFTLQIMLQLSHTGMRKMNELIIKKSEICREFKADIVNIVCVLSRCSDTYLGETCRDDNQVEECTSASRCAIAQVSLWYLPLTTIQARISHIYMSMNSMYKLQFLCTRWYTEWHRLTSLWPEMWRMWPWEEEWGTNRGGMKASSDEAQVSGWLLISCDSCMSACT